MIVAVFLFSSYHAVSTGKSSLASIFHSEDVSIQVQMAASDVTGIGGRL
jgi:hypothetical protein